jgi:hypothetical protein
MHGRFRGFYTIIILLLQICMIDLEVFLPFVDIGGIDDHHYLDFLFMTLFHLEKIRSI